MILSVFNGANDTAIISQELDLIACAIRHRGQFAETRVLAVQERVASLSGRQVLRGDMLTVAIEHVDLVRRREWNAELPVFVVIRKVWLESQDMKAALIGHMQDTIRRNRQSRYRGELSVRREECLGAAGIVHAGARVHILGAGCSIVALALAAQSLLLLTREV